jgi:hypothetical protein
MPSCRRRRWATTTKLAAATSETRKSATAATVSTITAAATSSGRSCLPEILMWSEPMVAPSVSVGSAPAKASTCASGASTRSDTELGEARLDGGWRTNSSSRSLGFSTTPTTVRWTPSRAKVAPISASNVSAIPSVMATSASVVG